MRRPHKFLAAAVACAALGLSGGAVASAAGSGGDPTAAQVASAIRGATRSRQLWATINRCGTGHGQEIGIRAEMPALDFPAHLVMLVGLKEYSATSLRYVPVKGSYRLGGKVFDSGATVQEGISLRFAPGVTLIGQVRFEWIRDGRVLGQATRTTSAGHPADAGTPRGTSVGTCSLL